MTTKSPIKSDGSVDIEFLESECKRLSDKQKQTAKNNTIMHQINTLNELIGNYRYVNYYGFLQAILVLAELYNSKDGTSTQKAILNYIERYNSVQYNDMSEETRIDMMNLVCKAVPSGILSYDIKANWFYRTGDITPSELIYRREVDEEAQKYNGFIGKLKKIASKVW